MCEGKKYAIHEEYAEKSNPNYKIRGACIMFQNQGNHGVHVGNMYLLPGDTYKIDIMPPNYIDQNISIRFDSFTTTVTSLRVAAVPRLLISTLLPE